MSIADINTLARFLTKTDVNGYTAAQLLITVNKYYEQITGLLLAETAASRFPYGDFNFTAFPSFTINMTAGTQAYNFTNWGTTDEETPLVILGAEVLDNNSIWQVLRRISLKEIQDIKGVAQSEYQKTNGLPREYELRDNQLLLYPAPATANVTLASGLRLFHLRSADTFTSAEVTTGTKEPGFPRGWHYLIAVGAAYDYAIAGELVNASQLKLQYDEGLKEMINFISKRDPAERPVFRSAIKSFR